MRRRSGIPCTRCGGQMFFEQDLMHKHVACKCLQCGFIAAYFWTEPGWMKPEFEVAGRVGNDTMLLPDEDVSLPALGPAV